jgi:chemotaxis protein MotB
MSFHKSKKNNNDAQEEDWLITYSDAVTLILCFFVLLISVSEPKKSKIEQMQEQFAAQMKEEVQTEDPLKELAENVQKMISENMLDEVMSVEETEHGILIELASSSFFESGEAKFKATAVPILLDMSAVLQDFDYDDYIIEVEGHTDDVPIQGSELFPSNWELSGARASGVVRFFIEEGLDKMRMRAKAYADIQPKVPNIDEMGNPIEENREINRRIAIRIERN